MSYLVEPIAYVKAQRKNPEDDYWGNETADICLAEHLEASALLGIDSFSHVEVIFLFHGVTEDKIITGARHPRNNTSWPKVGIFAQRGKNRPNRIGSTICKIISVEGKILKVKELDAIDGTPVIDIKPVIKEFLPRGATIQPEWATELMTNYWSNQ